MGVNSSQLHKDPLEEELKKTQVEKYAPVAPVWKRIEKHGYFSKNYRGNPRSSSACFVMPNNAIWSIRPGWGRTLYLTNSRIWEKSWAESTIFLPHSTRKEKVFLSQQFTESIC